MLIVTVLRAKGDFVATVPPTRPSVSCCDTLAEHRIGAVVVSSGRRASSASCPNATSCGTSCTVGSVDLLDQPVGDAS